MLVIHYPDDPRPPRWHQPVLALGNFDGMHRGHLKIIERVRRGAEERGATAIAMTFDPHPSTIVRPDKAPPLLMTNQQKLDALARAGMHGVAIVRFTPDIAQWDPEMFVRTVLVEWLHVAEVWVGANFLFGRDRAGTFSALRSLGARYGFRAEKINPVRYKDFVVSSTRIRRLVTEGRVDEAGALLGHHYAIEGTVVTGQQRGRGLGFPTAQTCAPKTSSCPLTACMRRRPFSMEWRIHRLPISGRVRPSTAANERQLDAPARLRQGPLRRAAASRVRTAGCATRRGSTALVLLKKQIEADRDRAQDLFNRMGL